MPSGAATPKRKGKKEENRDQKKKKKVESLSGNESAETNNLDQDRIEEILKYVQNKWNIDEDGDLKKRKNKYYKSENKKDLPKKALYFFQP